jgi:hypothetical protein
MFFVHFLEILLLRAADVVFISVDRLANTNTALASVRRAHEVPLCHFHGAQPIIVVTLCEITSLSLVGVLDHPS